MLKHMRKLISLVLIIAFWGSSSDTPLAQAGEMVMPLMPKPGTVVNLSPAYTPAHLQGIIIHPDNALHFDFLVHKGEGDLSNAQKKMEYSKLIKYFLASLTIPDENQWVNLSPYEHNRIIKDDFGKTAMGRDLLTQDYLLKQITSSLVYPETGLGKKFWDKVYERAEKEYGSTNIPVNTFNKIWITPDEAVVYESGNTAYILKSHLKVMLEEDYLSLQKHSTISPSLVKEGDRGSFDNTHTIASKIVKTIILPEIEKEVNEGKNFAMLRQIYSGMILATWYKRVLKESLLGKVYVDKAKVKGVDQDPKTNQAIYSQYLAAFKKGVFNYIKEDVGLSSQQLIPRKYFAGGWAPNPDAEHIVTLGTINGTQAKLANQAQSAVQRGQVDLVDTKIDPADTSTNAAMMISPEKFRIKALVAQMVYSFKKTGDIGKGNKAEFLRILQLEPLQADEVWHWWLDGIGAPFESVHGDFSDDSKALLGILAQLPVKAGEYFARILRESKLPINTMDKYEIMEIIDEMIDVLSQGKVCRISYTDQGYGKVFGMEDFKDYYLYLTGIDPYSQYEQTGKNGSPSEDMYLSNFASEYRRDFTTYEYHTLSLVGSEGISVKEFLDRRLEDSGGLEYVDWITLDTIKQKLIRKYGWKGKLLNAYQKKSIKKEMKGRPSLGVELYLFILEYYSELCAHAYNEEQMKRTLNALLDFTAWRNSGPGAGLTIEQFLALTDEEIKDSKIKGFGPKSLEEFKKTVKKLYGWTFVSDMAMGATPLGGIDLNSAHLDLLIKRDGRGVPLPLYNQDIAQLNRIEGFKPFIITIKPIISLPFLSELQQRFSHSPMMASVF